MKNSNVPFNFFIRYVARISCHLSLVTCLVSLVPCHLHQAFADSSSTNYGLVEDRFTGGTGSASSANYQIAETSFESFSTGSLSSTNYGLTPKVGINAATNIVSINSVSPSNYSRHFSDENATFTVTAVDPDSDTLEYRAKQDTTTKDGPQASNELSWALSSSDLGRHTMNLSKSSIPTAPW